MSQRGTSRSTLHQTLDEAETVVARDWGIVMGRLREILEGTFWGRVLTWSVAVLIILIILVFTLAGIERMAGAIRGV